ncbi:MAG: hypothetical protein IPL73_00625 [Candidatus Obscuribacter sp.]|nr:hypothetical protein [Candidatus Obscuribacter sp.]
MPTRQRVKSKMPKPVAIPEPPLARDQMMTPPQMIHQRLTGRELSSGAAMI